MPEPADRARSTRDEAAERDRDATPWSDLDRPPLSARRLQAALTDGPVWREVRVVDATDSTNVDVAAAAAEGAAEGLVLFAERQTGGRGRLDRRWESPARAGLLVSVLLRPAVPVNRLPLLPLLAGVAVVEAVRSVARLDAVLKWPNDVLVDDRKLAGVLVERGADGAVVVGLGLNVSTRLDELPVPTATSLALAGGGTDREPLAKEVLRAFARRYLDFLAAGGAPESLVPAYREVCETIGRDVVVHVPSGEPVSGRAVAVDDNGMLVVRSSDGREQAWSAGDVVHVRAEG
ncbi:MAG TPA: biotin--[acetyl-CoA-carboxylase] ligase [Mycobacteriales bacterium]|nr:biotin--[acetyl-CoA-carboxylase] ligase [Mycobacteriales bacterium]